MPASLYHPLYFIVVGILCMAVSFRYISSPDFRLQTSNNQSLFPYILCLGFIFWLGFRPISGYYFGDTANYAFEYVGLQSDNEVDFNWKSEWLWAILMLICKSLDFPVSVFFTIVEAGYFLFAFAAIRKFLPSNPLLGLLFLLSSLMFYNFGVNGLRNGLACSILFLAITYFLENKYLPAVIVCILAFGTHRSMALPIMAILLARYVVKDYRYAVYGWIACIIISVVAGNLFVNLLGDIGFDERLSNYNTSEYDDSFSSSGFRIDFLIYSVPPIILSWNLLVKHKIKDDWYRILSTAYCIANAFWILIIRIAFTNRFAYLSWFLYPILIAYPIMNLPIWRDQDKKIGLTLAIYCSFTLFMQLIVW